MEAQVNTDEEQSVAVVADVSCVDVATRRGKLFALESAMLAEKQVDIPVNHRFCGGMYAREITIPKGTLLTGRIHKFEHFDIMLSGDISVSTDTGEIKRLTGLNIMEGKPGKKRAGYAHADTHWITFHSAEECDPELMYDMLTCSSFEELEQFNIQYQAAVARIESDEKELTRVAEGLASGEIQIAEESACQL